MEFLLTSPLLPVLVALAPAALRLWWGRRLARLANDPALPERLLSKRSRSGIVFGIAFGLLVTGWSDRAVWTLPLLVVSRFAAGYPLRKVLYNETWSFARYLSFFPKLVVAFFGVWILVAMAPWLTQFGGERDWLIAALLSGVLVGWSAFQANVIRFVVGARPVVDPALTSRFTRLADSCGLPTVTFDRVDLNGGVFANAVALASVRRPGVIFTETLLERLDRNEIVAICAHELAHLEHYNALRLRRQAIANVAMIGAATLVAPIVRVVYPSALWLVEALWPMAMFTALCLRAKHRQRHETTSDLRAVELTGDHEALVRALTKLHVIARIPRRWETQAERQSTHPSLARRIQAIRAAANCPPPTLADAVRVAGADGISAVTFREDRLEWSEHNVATHTLSYAHLAELRIDTRRAGTPRLVAIDRSGRRWEASLASDDVARTQAVLDVIDTRLAAPLAPPGISLTIARAVSLMLAMTACALGYFSLGFTALLAVLQPVTSLVAAAGVAALAAAALTWRDYEVFTGGNSATPLAIVFFVCGVALLRVARANRNEKNTAAVAKLTVCLGLCAALAWAGVLMDGVNPVRLHQRAYQWPAASVLSLALATAAAFSSRRTLRYASLPLVFAGLGIGFVGSGTFLTHFGGDPFLAPAESFALKRVSSVPFAEFSVPFAASDMRVSPSGRHVALVAEGEGEEDERTTFHIGRAGGELTEVEADAAVFVDDDRLLLLSQDREGAILREVAVEDATRVIRQQQFPDLFGNRMAFNPVAKTWRLVGWTRAGEIVRTEGHIGSSTVVEQRWPVSRRANRGVNVIATSGPHALMLDREYERGWLSASSLSTWLYLVRPLPGRETHLWTLGPQGRAELATSHLDLGCENEALPGDRAVCTAFDGKRTRLVAIDPHSGSLTALGSFEGRFFAYGGSDSGWLNGWSYRTAIALRLDTREALTVAPSNVTPTRVVGTDHVLGAITALDGSSTVRLYRMATIPPAAQHSRR